MALGRQPAVTLAQAQTDAARGRRVQARAGLLPQVSGTALAQRSDGPTAPRATSGTSTAAGANSGAAGVTTASGSATGTTGPTTTLSVGISASQVIWDFGQTWHRLKAADHLVSSSQQNQAAVARSVLLGVRQAYFQALAAQALLDVAGEALTNQKRHAIQVEGFVRAGIRPEIDLAQSKAAVASSTVALVRARNQYDVSKAQLNRAIGAPGSVDYDVRPEDFRPVDGEERSVDALLREAIEARPELRGLAEQQRSQQQTVSAIRSAYGPVLSATGSASRAGQSLDDMRNGWAVGAVLSWPFFQGGLRSGQLDEARANLRVTAAQLETQRLAIRFDLEQATLTLHASKEALGAAHEAVEAAREQLRLAEARYSSGVGSIIELGDAQISQTNASAQEVQARYDLALARASLLAALGRS